MFMELISGKRSITVEAVHCLKQVITDLAVLNTLKAHLFCHRSLE